MAKRQQAKKMAAAGKSAAQIQNRTGVSAKAAQRFTSRAATNAGTNNSMKIDRQDVISNPGNYDKGYSREVASQNPYSAIYQGMYGGGLSDGEGGTHKLQGFHVPGATNGIGPDSDVLFAAGGNVTQDWMNANFGVGGRYYGGDKQASGGTGGDSGGGGGEGTTNTKEIKGLGQGIRLAGGGGGISKGELNTLMESGKNQGQIIRQLDKVNAKLKENGKGSINLKSGAANMLIRQGNKARSDIYGAARRPFEFGEGRIGQQLTDMSGLTTPTNTRNRKLFNSPQREEEFTPEFLTRGIDLTGRGATGKTVRGVGKQYEGQSGKPDTTPGGDTGGGDMGDGGDIGTGIDSPINETIEETNKGMSSGAGGLDLASWATGFKKAQSARQRAGRKAQGLASQKKTPFKSWNS